jgi:predicted metalloprotease with PDZ domain
MKRLTWLLGAVAVIACAQASANVTLTVKLPNPGQKLLFVEEAMPVKPGPLTLYYPKWIPGDHSPDGEIEKILGVEFTAGGQRLAWHRDELDKFTFNLTIPEGADRLDIRFEFPARDRITANLIDLTWDAVAFYQSGSPTKTQIYEPSIVIPADWQVGTALQTAKREGATVTFKPVPFNTLVDSPVIAGKYFRSIDVTPAGASVHRFLDMVGDSDASIKISDKQLAGFRSLVEQAQALFHSHHYDSYHFLLTLSDHTSVGGLEHHQSSDDRARSGSKMFADADHFMLDGSLLPHEYTHSWNGKFMRPAGLWQPDFEQPERAGLLWVYEGLTVYLGDVLTVRSGLWSADTWREVVAYRAANMAHRTGRAWRPLGDTSVAVHYGAPDAWANWGRQNDFYPEGEVFWLAVDMKIRELSHDNHSIDDFARAFFGVDNGSFVTHTYEFEDVVTALNNVQPFDWAKFLNTWVNGVDPQVPLLSGIEASGWKLTYTDKPSGYQNAIENVGPGELEGKGVNALFSAGMFLDGDGKIIDVIWNGPAFKAGLAPGMKLVSIDGRVYSTNVLWSQIAAAQKNAQPMQINAQQDGEIGIYTVHYNDGLKYPNLIRVQGKTDYLQRILAPKAKDNGS